mgnify:CR=1 FL=1
MNDDKYKHRQIDLYMPMDEVRDLAKRGVPGRALHEALGYAMAYTAVGDYDSADIALIRGEISAVYTKGEREKGIARTFVMGGIWRPEFDAFTFHS